MLPRNVRCKTPRPPRVRARVCDGTPTPAPVVVALAAPPSQRTQAKLAKSRRVGAALFLCLLAITVGGSATGLVSRRGLVAWSALNPRVADASITTEPSAAAPPESTGSIAGWKVIRAGYVPITGGVLMLPESFVPSPDGSYDLVIHFHGNRLIVEESVAYAGLNAAVATVNLGISSTPYRDAFRVPKAFESLLAEIQAGMRQRGVPSPRLARVALTSWSAGFGAIESILEHRKRPAGADPLDAIIAVDGIHATFVDFDPRRLRARTIEAFTRAAQAAARGELLVSMTHSQIDPISYCSAKRSQLFILDQLETPATRAAVLPAPPHLSLPSARNAVYEGKEKRMVPLLDARIGDLRVQGFEGHTAEHHTAHLTQMAAVVLPDLAARWAKR
jgi:hypothetical protein